VRKRARDCLFLGAEDGGACPVDHAPLDHDVQLVGDRLGELHVLLDQQDRDALLAQQTDDAGELAHDQGRQPLARLVEQHHLGIGHQRPGDRQHLLLAARELRALVVGALAQRGEQVEQPGERPGAAGRAFADLYVLDHREIGKDQPSLGHVGHALARHQVGRPAGDVGAADMHAPAAQANQPHDGLHHRRLADAVAAEHGADAALRHVEVDALQDMAGAIMRVHALDPEHQAKPPR
jgi:hypothetical protein